MDSGDSKPTDVEWNESCREQMGTPTPVEDEDGIMLQALGVCDGFRPTMVTTRSISNTSSATSYPTEETTPMTGDCSSTVPPLVRQSSITKSPIHKDKSTTGHGVSGEYLHPVHDAIPSYPLSRQGSSATSISTTSSAFTDAVPVLVREQSYQGPSGPSHPYTMYRQDIGLNRSMSVNTTSTAGPWPEQQFIRPVGPVHPYGLYAQNTVGLDQIVANPVMAAPNAGFPGVSADSYRRRLGPDGEEIGGMIGPHGHTEELPPYTRYPDEQYARKVRDAEAFASGQSLSSVTQTNASQQRQQDNVSLARLSIPGAGGLGIAARNPEFDSIEDLTSASYESASNLSQHEINTAAAAVVSEKIKPTRRWQKTGKRRLCGIIPYWAVLLALTALLATAIILGAVIGTTVARREQEPPSGGPPPGPTTLYDAVPIPIPTDLPDLPEGKFSIPLLIRQQSNICFNETTQAQAWSCNIIFGYGAGMTLEVKKDASRYSVSIGANESLTINNGLYAYGTQPHILQGTHKLQTVDDLLEPSRGPAWFKMLSFNKTVILPENMLSVTAPNSRAKNRRRALNPPVLGSNDFRRRFAAQPGDKPWICTWPDTLLEIFIYPGQNSSPPRIGEKPSSIVAVIPTPATPSITRGPSFPFLTGTAVPSGVFSDFFGATERFSLPSPGPTPTILPGEGEFAPAQPGYPRVVKIEERRVQKSPRPICRQVLIENDGTAKPLFNNGKPVEITILEQGNSPPLSKRSEADDSPETGSPRVFRRDAADVSDCGCVWFMT